MQYSQEEKRRALEIREQKRIGYLGAEVERARRIRSTNFQSNIEILMPGFEAAATMPHSRRVCGLIEFYSRLKDKNENGI